MGLPLAALNALVEEHKYRPIQGSILTIGRQVICLGPENYKDFFDGHGIALPPGHKLTLDKCTTFAHAHRKSGEFISDTCFFSAFGDCQVTALDVSSIEEAEILWDLTKPIPEDLQLQFDFVVNGSCLDNISDPMTALKNMSRMVKPGGRIFHLEFCSALPNAYIRFSPEWFSDYYAINNYNHCKTYIIIENNGTEEYWFYDPLDANGNYIMPKVDTLFHYRVMVIAERGPASTFDRSPIQTVYRHGAEQCREYADAARVFRASSRPVYWESRPVPLGTPTESAQAVADRMSGRIGQGVFVRQYEKEGLRPMDMRYGNDDIFPYIRRPDAAPLLEGPFLDDVISAKTGR